MSQYLFLVVVQFGIWMVEKLLELFFVWSVVYYVELIGEVDLLLLVCVVVVGLV